MKTKYFNRYSLPKDKKDHLSTLTKLDDIQFQIIEDITKEQNAVRKLTNLEIRDLVEKTKLSAENVIDAAVAFKWVLGFFSLEV